ncbi:MAG: homoserine dehydrogenase [Trueperaceae bacterium]|nr:MAG: homoserine dehydrogenase [Trueperaceae bacterium]
MTERNTIGPRRVGLLGVGTVGTALVNLLGERQDVPATISKALVRDLEKPRSIVHPERLLTTDAAEVLENADILVELMGGVSLAGDLMLEALEAGKRVVTANKAVLAERWESFEDYLKAGLLYYEAAVMAGTPVIGPLTDALRGSKPLELHGILNGTCTYILSKLEEGSPYQEALAEAQRLGYAEADPTLDVEGFDAAHKLTILARLSFDPSLSWEKVKAKTHGISHLTPAIVKEAMEDGGRVRLLGSVYPSEGEWRVEVRPVYLPASHPLAASEGTRNAVLFRGDAVGEVFISGAGAGAEPTASAVLADVLNAVESRPGPRVLSRAFKPPLDYRPDDLGELKRE